jgi:predicted dehydrogenase/threonine dehydrogenase-like Zn-dependent dehydrogenase
MKQVVQNLKSGALEIAEVPTPTAQPGMLLIRTRCSLISAGTERMLIEFARSGLLSKARQQPEKVKQVLDKIRTDGFWAAYEAVRARLDEPMPLGYCNCGSVIGVGEGVTGWTIGERVASNGPHAEIVSVPVNLCARVPEAVSDEEAAGTVLAAIGLQGIRLMNPTFGETIAVSGLGLIGLLACQLLKAGGCRVLGIDPDPERLALAARLGAETIDLSAGADPIGSALALTGGRGVDGVLVAAAAQGDQIIHQAAQMCRRRGRIILVGVVDLALQRSDFYEKELTFRVSCSYGPGRYDEAYERGRDYPPGFVRWTAQRNFAAVLGSMASGQIEVAPLISKRLAHADAPQAYESLRQDAATLGILLSYPAESITDQSITMSAPPAAVATDSGQVVVGVLGAGNFARRTLLPILKRSGARLRSVAALDGVGSWDLARKFGFEQAAGDARAVLDDDEVNLVIIATRHDSHAALTAAALKAGKYVAVEKPLCLNREELAEIKEALAAAGNRLLLVGFNRRFAPHAQRIRALLSSRSGPLCMSVLVNAGEIPPESWIQDPAIGGGRMIGEGGHWLDLMRFFVGAPICSVGAMMVGGAAADAVRSDKMTVTVGFTDGSLGTLHYFANGPRSFPKEIVELFCDGRALHLDNFRRLTGYGWPGFRRHHLWRQDKGHREQFRKLLARVRSGGQPLMPFAEIENVTLASFAAVEAARGAGVVAVP